MIYYKQEKFNLAEIHFKKALSINPQSSVLLCHIGVVSLYIYCSINIVCAKDFCWCCFDDYCALSQVQHALKKSDHALETLNRAISIDPKNPLCKFHRASILFANEKYKVCISYCHDTFVYLQKQFQHIKAKLINLKKTYFSFHRRLCRSLRS